jgi:hypothetical protein
MHLRAINDRRSHGVFGTHVNGVRGWKGSEFEAIRWHLSIHCPSSKADVGCACCVHTRVGSESPPISALLDSCRMVLLIRFPT